MATQSDKHKGKASRCSARAACWSRASWSEVIDKLEKKLQSTNIKWRHRYGKKARDLTQSPEYSTTFRTWHMDGK